MSYYAIHHINSKVLAGHPVLKALGPTFIKRMCLEDEYYRRHGVVDRHEFSCTLARGKIKYYFAYNIDEIPAKIIKDDETFEYLYRFKRKILQKLPELYKNQIINLLNTKERDKKEIKEAIYNYREIKKILDEVSNWDD